MAESTKIQWATHTFNPWVGCTKVSDGCKNCYAEFTTFTRAQRKLGKELWGKGKARHRTSETTWKMPHRWDAQARILKSGWQAGIDHLIGSEKKALEGGFIKPEPPRVFPSLCDWLDDEVPIEWLCDFLFLVYSTPHLNWLLLTKRPENFEPRLMKILRECGLPNMLFAEWLMSWVQGKRAPVNVWVGASVENQKYADERIPLLLRIPAVIHFLSVEPLLGAIDLTRLSADDSMPVTFNALTGFGSWTDERVSKAIDWVIVGGESGDKARPCKVDWIVSIIEQCQAAGVACFVKQIGRLPVMDNANMWDWPDRTVFEAFGTKSKGFAASSARLVDEKGGDPNEWPLQVPVLRQFPKSDEEGFAA